MKAYVLQEVGWEYNDEFYYKNNGGVVEKVYLNKETAEKAALVATAEFFKGTVGYANKWYGVQPFEYVDFQNMDKEESEQMRNKLNCQLSFLKDFVPLGDDMSWTVPKDISLEDSCKVAQIVRDVAGVSFYEVVETDIEEE